MDTTVDSILALLLGWWHRRLRDWLGPRSARTEPKPPATNFPAPPPPPKTSRPKLRNAAQYSQAMLSVRITPELVEKLRQALSQPSVEMVVGRIDFNTFLTSDYVERLTFSEFADMLARQPERVESIAIYFALDDMRGDAIVAHMCWSIHQTFSPNYARDATPTLELQSHASSRDNFDAFVSAATKVLGTQAIAAHGLTLDDTRLRERFLSRWVDPDLLAHTSGAVAARQYDVAIKAAIGVVETRLRARCVAAGRVDAKKLGGADLAVEAFHKDKGCLNPPWPVATEAATGAQLLFQGFFLYLRNAFAHHSVVMGADASAVYDALAACEFLLKVIEKSTLR